MTMEREGIKYIYIFFAEKYTRIGVILIIFSSVWFDPRERGRGKRSRLRRKLQPASININSAAWKGRESYTLELGRLWSSLRSLSSTAGYVSDGQVARGGATELEETKGARESGKREGKDGRYCVPPDAETFLFIRIKWRVRSRVEKKKVGLEASIR